MNIDIKLKTYEQLQFEIQTLITKNYLLQQENQQLKKQKEELVKFLDQIIKKLNEAEFADELFSPIGVKKTSYALKMVLDKMNELEGEDNEKI